jgi:hypothetical protein
MIRALEVYKLEDFCADTRVKNEERIMRISLATSSIPREQFREELKEREDAILHWEPALLMCQFSHAKSELDSAHCPLNFAFVI